MRIYFPGNSYPGRASLVTIACALVLLKSTRNAKTAGDAMLSVGAMAIGYLLMNLRPSTSNVSGDVCTTLFGSVSILTLTDKDLWLCAGLSLGVVVCWLHSYNRLFDVTFDECHAKACGTNTALFNAVWAVVVAVVIVISMRLGGVLEFMPKDSYVWPTNFPPVESRITLTGRLQMFEVGTPEQSFTIPRLVDADISALR